MARIKRRVTLSLEIAHESVIDVHAQGTERGLEIRQDSDVVWVGRADLDRFVEMLLEAREYTEPEAV